MNHRAHFRQSAGFSLVELLVVIAVIAILASLLLPGLRLAKERTRRANCLNNQHQFALAILIYATDNGSLLLAPGTDNYKPDDTHTPILSTNAATNILRYTSTVKSLDCPNLHEWMQQRGNWRYQMNYGIAIGYHYFGGHAGTPWESPEGTTNRWISPQKSDDSPNFPLLADLNVYCYSFQRILAPHTDHGPVVREDHYFADNNDAVYETPRNIGARGGNIAFLDGSASWRPVEKMKSYKASHLWEKDGAYGIW